MQPKILIGRTKLRGLNEFCYRGSILSNYALMAKELENHTKMPACLLASWRPGAGAELPGILKERTKAGGSHVLVHTPGFECKSESGYLNRRVILSCFFSLSLSSLFVLPNGSDVTWF